MTDKDAREVFLRGARMKIDGHNRMAEGQRLMEQAAWLTHEDGRPKVEVPATFERWLQAEPDFDRSWWKTLGCGEHSVLRWLIPANRDRVMADR